MVNRHSDANTHRAHPLFAWDLDYLAEISGYSVRYLRMVKRGEKPAPRRMRKLFALALDKPEEELFKADPEPAHV